MRPLNFKILFLLILLSVGKRLVSQSLVLNGYMKDNSGKNIKCDYELRSSCDLLASGHGSKLKLNLESQGVYTLTISGPGYQSKTIQISTFTNSDRCYNFYFHIGLESSNTASEAFVRAGDIFYNSDRSGYDYRSYLSKQSEGKP